MSEKTWADADPGFDENGRPTDGFTRLLFERRYRGADGQWVYVPTEFTEKSRAALLVALLIYLVGLPVLSFVLGIIGALSLTTLVSLALLGARLHERRERRREVEVRKEEWMRARMAEHEAQSRLADSDAVRDPVTAGLGGIAAASVARDAWTAAGEAAGNAATATGGGNLLRSIDLGMRASDQADGVAASVRGMELSRRDLQAQLAAEWTAFEAQNLAMNPDLTGSGSDSLLGGLE